MSDFGFEPGVPFQETQIKRIEEVIGRRLPDDYVAFVKQYGGAFVGGYVDGSEDFPILAFFDASEEKGILRNLNALPDLMEDGILPFADCELGNVYVFDKENRVHYINYYGGKTTSKKIANDFGDFLRRIVVNGD